MSDPRLPAAYLMPGSSSFSDFLAVQAPDLLPRLEERVAVIFVLFVVSNLGYWPLATA